MPHGRLTFNIFASLAEFERDLIRERTQAGLSAARARGRLGGRPKGLSKKAKSKAVAAETLYRKGEHSVQEIAKMLKISKSTLYAYLRHQGVEIGVHRKKTKTMKVELWLRVENNNKFVRGRKKAREEIEYWVLSRYQMKKQISPVSIDVRRLLSGRIQWFVFPVGLVSFLSFFFLLLVVEIIPANRSGIQNEGHTKA